MWPKPSRSTLRWPGWSTPWRHRCMPPTRRRSSMNAKFSRSSICPPNTRGFRTRSTRVNYSRAAASAREVEMALHVTYDDLNGVVGVVPTPATADADRWEAGRPVNIPETVKMIEAVVEAGIDVVMTTATFGEVASLTWEELREFVDCVIRTVGGRRPVFPGVTTLNTRDTIMRGRTLIEMGADGLFIGRPMWTALSDRQIVQFYRDVSDALPHIPIIVYDNPRAFRRKIPPEVYRELTNIRGIIGAKQSGGPGLEQDIAALGRAIKSRDWDAAAVFHEKFRWATETIHPSGDAEKFADYSIALCRVRFRAAGLIDPGPSRPPYVDLPEEYIGGAAEVGRRWRVLEEEYASQAVAG